MNIIFKWLDKIFSVRHEVSFDKALKYLYQKEKWEKEVKKRTKSLKKKLNKARKYSKKRK